MPPKHANGNEERMVKGWMKLSYKIPNTAYIATTARMSSSTVSLLVLSTISATPSSLPETEVGRVSTAIFFIRSRVSARGASLATSKDKVMLESRSRCSMLCNPTPSFQEATDLRGIDSPDEVLR